MQRSIYLLFLTIVMVNPVFCQQTSKLDDEFDDPLSINEWKLFHQEEAWPNHVLKLDIDSSTAGCLHVEPEVGFWYGEVHCGPYLYREIEGDFTAVTSIKVSGKTSEVPLRLFSLAGLMVRSPRPVDTSKDDKNQENWLFLTTGFAKKTKSAPVGPQFETKVTINSNSSLEIFTAPQGWIEMAISRIGSVFYLSYRADDGSWVCLREIAHPHMATQTQIGFIAYTDFNNKMKRRYLMSRKKLNTTVYKDGKPDLVARAEYFRITKPKQETPLSNYDDLATALSLPQ